MMAIPARYILVALVFCGVSTVPLLRVNLSIAIISMVNSTKIEPKISEQSNQSYYVCPRTNVTVEEHEVSGPFEWDLVEQGSILGCYFYLYIVSSALGPWIARRFGFKLVVGVAVALSSLATIAMPPAAYHSLGFFMAMRIILGGFQGAVIPTMLLGLPPWIPPKSISFAYSLVCCGYPLGIFVTLPISSIIAETCSWETVFYITGSISLFWSAMWFLLVYDTPEHHPRISQKEKRFLISRITKTRVLKEDGSSGSVPIVKILTSLPVWALFLPHIALDWTITVSTVLVPTYMTSVLNMDISKAGLSSGLPYLMGVAVIIISGKVSDILRDHTPLSLTLIRKIYAILAMGGSGICISCVTYVGCNGTAATTLLLVAVTLMQFHYTGTEVTVFDISPTYCGIIFGIAQALSLSTGFLAPQIAGYILTKNDLSTAWRIIFFITAGINFFAALFFVIFGTTEEQEWSKEVPKSPNFIHNTENDKSLLPEEEGCESSSKA